jgi:putative sterol carrier protein
MDDLVLNQIEAGIKRVMADPVLKGELAGWKRTVLIKVDRDQYTIRVENDVISVAREKARNPDVEIKLKKATFMEIVTGKLPFTTAYLRGLLEVKGDVKASDITRLQKLL